MVGGREGTRSSVVRVTVNERAGREGVTMDSVVVDVDGKVSTMSRTVELVGRLGGCRGRFHVRS
jgi:hypothetical protein